MSHRRKYKWRKLRRKIMRTSFWRRQRADVTNVNRFSRLSLLHEGEWERRGLVPLINPYTRWRWLFNFKPRPPYPGIKSFVIHRRLGRPRVGLEALEGGVFLVAGIELRFLGCPARSLTTVPAEVCRLPDLSKSSFYFIHWQTAGVFSSK